MTNGQINKIPVCQVLMSVNEQVIYNTIRVLKVRDDYTFLH